MYTCVLLHSDHFEWIDPNRWKKSSCLQSCTDHVCYSKFESIYGYVTERNRLNFSRGSRFWNWRWWLFPSVIAMNYHRWMSIAYGRRQQSVYSYIVWIFYFNFAIFVIAIHISFNSSETSVFSFICKQIRCVSICERGINIKNYCQTFDYLNFPFLRPFHCKIWTKKKLIDDALLWWYIGSEEITWLKKVLRFIVVADEEEEEEAFRACFSLSCQA